MLYYSCIGPSVWYLWSVSWTIVLMLLYYRPHALQYHHTPVQTAGLLLAPQEATHTPHLRLLRLKQKETAETDCCLRSAAASYAATIRKRGRPWSQNQPTTALAQNPVSESCSTEIPEASGRCEVKWGEGLAATAGQSLPSHPRPALQTFWRRYLSRIADCHV